MEHLEQKFIGRKATPETVVEERARPGGYRVREIVGRVEDEEKYPDYLEVHDIEYETPDGKVFRFKQLLPEGWRLFRMLGDEKGVAAKEKHIRYGNRHEVYRSYAVPKGETLPSEVQGEDLRRFVDSKSRRVTEYFSPKQIEHKGFFLGLLHEFGHAYIVEAMTLEERAKNIKAVEMLKQKLERGARLSREEKALHQRLVFQIERDAWAWALCEFRKLRQAGIDLEPELQSPQKIFAAIRGALKTQSLKDLSRKEFNEAWRAAQYIEDKTVEPSF